MASSKSSQTTRNIVMSLLALWSIVSLIIIVVWATSPDLKSASQCRAELQAQKEKSKGESEVCAKNKTALEEMVKDVRANLTQQISEIERLQQHLNHTNRSLDDCRQEKVILCGNITVLENEIDSHKAIEANLTSEITLHQGSIVNEERCQGELKICLLEMTPSFSRILPCWLRLTTVSVTEYRSFGIREKGFLLVCTHPTAICTYLTLLNSGALDHKGRKWV
uniref:Uncharacterized protein n=1 Tax=Esox lucius TaxID=8010 RepID=A0AAY5L3T2_ESOLU